jgi:hypothetical protein|uniref:Uncharacterized protein n=1 Tax=Myoviridae sp. ctwmI4 TaxID=2826710 RepID=A0A8S5LUU0_9CAUD|nr:MAG TPA: hypothetical protein [Caudoviricetes sp.]DAD73587.1 MAG TPA: hypothetical protein [Myoviridae sp. ctwmI4]DAE86419.1 MAG TPA: hypothetical protein [Caudoviricetes sp.]DAX91675.1 MAG TPA: hypothetical protein [Caudoviricetes sp.]
MQEVALKRKKGYENRIDFFGLGDDVTEARNAGKSYMLIARELNKKHKKELQSILITPKMVGDWCRTNLIQEQSPTQETEVINTYNEQKGLLELVETQLEMIQLFIDDLQCQDIQGSVPSDLLYDRMKNLMLDQEKYIGRKQSILKDMQNIAEKIYTFQAMNAIILEIMRMVEQEDPVLAEKIKNNMKENKILLANYAKIQQNS